MTCSRCKSTDRFNLILVTSIGGRPKPEICFLPGRLEFSRSEATKSNLSIIEKRWQKGFASALAAASGVQMSADVRGDCLIVCPPNKIWYWAVTYGGHCYRIYTVCDVIIWHHNHVCKPNIWRKFVDTISILFYMRTPYSFLYNVSLQWI